MADKQGTYDHLTDMQRKYALHRVKGLERKDAMRAAGSSAKSDAALSRQAYEYENKPHVKEYMESLQKDLQERVLLEKEEVVDGLRDVIAAAMNEDTINLSAANKALELLGNHLGMFKQVVRTEDGSKKGESLKDTDDGGTDKDIERFNKILGIKKDDK